MVESNLQKPELLSPEDESLRNWAIEISRRILRWVDQHPLSQSPEEEATLIEGMKELREETLRVGKDLVMEELEKQRESRGKLDKRAEAEYNRLHENLGRSIVKGTISTTEAGQSYEAWARSGVLEPRIKDPVLKISMTHIDAAIRLVRDWSPEKSS